MLFNMVIELELPTDEEGLTDEGWKTYIDLQSVIETLRDEHGWEAIQRVRAPRRTE